MREKLVSEAETSAELFAGSFTECCGRQHPFFGAAGVWPNEWEGRVEAQQGLHDGRGHLAADGAEFTVFSAQWLHLADWVRLRGSFEPADLAS